MLTCPDFCDDIPVDLAEHAHQGTSFSPRERGAQERAGYEATLTQDFNRLLVLADTDEKRAVLPAEFERYRQGYRQRYVAMLAAKSRCVSTMIAGPSNFNTRRHQKSGDTADKRAQEMIEFRERAVAAIRKVLQPELQPIMTGDADAGERLTDKIAKLEAKQEHMRLVNAAIRRHKGHDSQVAALQALGLEEQEAYALLKPDFAGRVGFPAYELTNNAANIRRLKGRAVLVERNQALPDTAVAGVNARYEEAPAENRVRLYFPDKPAAEIRSRLKSRGFRWSPNSGAWQAYLNTSSIALAREIAGVSS
jgi:hypothetical protein